MKMIQTLVRLIIVSWLTKCKFNLSAYVLIF